MTPKEVVTLARYVRALCPQQRFDEFTPDAWGDLLGGYPLDDARAAAARVAARQPFVSPSEIITELGVIRGERLDGFQYEPVPGDDNPAAYLTSYRQQRAAVANGTRPPALTLALTGPPAPAVVERLATIGRDIPGVTRGPQSVKCPKCKSRVGQPCRTPGRSIRRPHAARRKAATAPPAPEPATTADRLTAARQALDALTPEERAQLAQETTR